MRLHEQLVMVPMSHANAYLWLAQDGVTLVDPGDAGDETIVMAALREFGRTERDLTRIVLTHCHPDHVGGAAALAAASGAQVWVGRADAAVVRGTTVAPSPTLTDAERPVYADISGHVAAAAPCPVHRELDDGDLLDPAGEAAVVGVPGHTPGSIAVFFPRLRAVLTGDVAVRFGDQVTLGPFNTDRARAWTSLQHLADLGVDVAGVGHGTPLGSGASAALAAATDPLA